MALPPVIELPDLDGSNGFAIVGRNAYDYSGVSLSAAGDVNGDGIDDIIIGAYRADPGGRYAAGESYVVFGRSGGFAAEVDLRALDGSNGFAIAGRNEFHRSGESVSAAGDVNGDGIDDLIIGANSASPAGESYVVFGRSSGFAAKLELRALDGSNGFVIPGRNGGDLSGWSLSDGGDVNGDGIDDLIIGAPSAYPGGRPLAGETYVVFGRGGGFAAELDLRALDGSNGFVIVGRNAGDNSGRVSAAGDVNGDGIDDIIIGAPRADPGGREFAGESYVVFGRSGGFGAELDLRALDGSNGFAIAGRNAYDGSGVPVSAAGDVNGDGIDDIIIGARDADSGGRDTAGESYVVLGRSGGFAAELDLRALDGSNGFAIAGPNTGDRSGQSVSAAGDVNGDGIDDIIIGAPTADPGGRDAAGESYVVFGQSSAVITGEASNDRLRGDVAPNRIEGREGNDRLEGAGNDDTLLGGDGRDQLSGGDGDDVLEGGLGRDFHVGGAGADVFVLAEIGAYDLIRDFSKAENDVLWITVPGLLDDTGEVDLDLLHVRDAGANLVLEFDADFDAATGFQAQTLATLYGAAQLGLADILEGAVA